MGVGNCVYAEKNSARPGVLVALKTNYHLPGTLDVMRSCIPSGNIIKTLLHDHGASCYLYCRVHEKSPKSFGIASLETNVCFRHVVDMGTCNSGYTKTCLLE